MAWRILGITWRDKIRNEDVRKRTYMEKLEEMMKKLRLRWLGHLHRSSEERIMKQAMDWTPIGWRRRRGRSRKIWRDMVMQDLEDGGMTWEVARAVAEDRVTWRSCVARCTTSAWKD
jgi:hypothetical protein